jgi:hypothetical protein
MVVVNSSNNNNNSSSSSSSSSKRKKTRHNHIITKISTVTNNNTNNIDNLYIGAFLYLDNNKHVCVPKERSKNHVCRVECIESNKEQNQNHILTYIGFMEDKQTFIPLNAPILCASPVTTLTMECPSTIILKSAQQDEDNNFVAYCKGGWFQDLQTWLNTDA